MGTSYADYRQLGFWARDDTVELWLWLLVQEVDASLAPSPWLRQAREHWYLHATAGFLGWVSASFDEYLAGDSNREAEFLVVLDRLSDRLDSYGRVIPTSVTDLVSMASGTQLNDVETDLMQEFTRAVAGLVRGEVAWDTGRRVPGVWSR